MMPLVPPLLLFLAKDPIVSEYDLSNLESILVGAAPVGKELSEEFLKRFPHVKFLTQGRVRCINYRWRMSGPYSQSIVILV